MKNPFDSFKHAKHNTNIELMEGPWECQDLMCESEAPEAKYLVDDSILTWKCAEGHVSKIEGFSLV